MDFFNWKLNQTSNRATLTLSKQLNLFKWIERFTQFNECIRTNVNRPTGSRRGCPFHSANYFWTVSFMHSECVLWKINGKNGWNFDIWSKFDWNSVEIRSKFVRNSVKILSADRLNDKINANKTLYFRFVRKTKSDCSDNFCYFKKNKWDILSTALGLKYSLARIGIVVHCSRVLLCAQIKSHWLKYTTTIETCTSQRAKIMI